MKIIISLCIFFACVTSLCKTPVHAKEESAKGDYVVILHGIARSNKHMQPLADYLSTRGYEVINLNYPSTEHPIEKLTDIVNETIVEKLTKEKPVHLIGYSMGGLMVRAIIHKHRPQTLGRVVLLAPPNHGSEVADFLEENWLYSKFYGPAGKQLTTNYSKDGELFGKVDYELGVIAGDFTIDPVSSSIIPGNDDGKVSVESTKLEGMKDFILLSASHTFFPSNENVQKQTAHFLMYGTFDHELD